MPLSKREDNIAAIQRTTGWVYPDLLWFSEDEAKLANQQRKELLDSVSSYANNDFRGTKLHTGPLSPGCLICGNGGWGCNFFNTICTRHCFYCPQDRTMTEERLPHTDGFGFKNPAEHILFLKAFRIKGIGFSGGEPLLVLDRLLAHMTAIRGEFGSSMYLWVYTNGDLINRDTLRRLRESGLDEIRFDLSARKYDLSPVILAKEYIPTLTVEIPAIPEDFELVKFLLTEMETIGVNFFNLHQLEASQCNYKALRQRNYHFLHQPFIPVFESEICALKLLVFAREHQVRLPVNYCCSAYKVRFQSLDKRIRQSRAVIKGFEEITDAGFIRSFHVLDLPDKIEDMIGRLEMANFDPTRWQCNEKKTELSIHSDLLSYVDWSSADVALLYLHPGVMLKNPADGFIEGNLIPSNRVVYQELGWNQKAIECWRKIYKEKKDSKNASTAFYREYPLKEKDAIGKLKRKLDQLKLITTWEELQTGLPEIY